MGFSSQFKQAFLFFNSRMKMNCFEILSIGGIDLALISNRDIFKGVLLTNSTGYILIHNHPSGDPSPSDDDFAIIKELKKQSKIMKINFINFVIIGDNDKFWSWKFKKK